MREDSPHRGHIPVLSEHLKCEYRDQMHPNSAGYMTCLSAGGLGAAAKDVSHTAKRPLRYSSLEVEAI